ncbi:MAG: DUF554 domain-containing protein [Firmicutes bacterium]|nr:DUF554 domain-containing protein [Bacillota bacterium]
MWGTLVNTVAIIVGSVLGWMVGKKLPKSMSDTIMQGLGLCVVLIGLQMAFSTQNVLVVIFSLVIGGILGEAGDIEGRFSRLSEWVERRFASGQEQGSVAKAFFTASLVYCVGAMAILGPIESALNSNHTVLYAKSMLDGVSSVVFASVMGPGVALSGISVLVYQGFIALLSSWIQPLLNDAILAELKSAGGLLITGIGFNIMGITRIKIGNLLPAVLVAPVLVALLPMLSLWLKALLALF